MRDPFSWSVPLVRLFGISVKVHMLFPVVVLGLILRMVTPKEAAPGILVEACCIVLLLFFSVLLHELGHCLGARLVDGDADEVMLWPLGGLASIDVPHTWFANLVATAFGPLVNLFLCVVIGLSFSLATNFQLKPPLNPLWFPVLLDAPGTVHLFTWHGTEQSVTIWWWVLMARAFWVNWVLFLLNVFLPAYPLDGGRIVQCVAWNFYGFRQATFFAIYAGFITAVIMLVVSLWFNEVFVLALVIMVWLTCRQQYILLETGGEESLFGYDFTQGYTSLEREQPPRRKRPNFWQRWLQNRAARRMKREQEKREAEEKRMDELLEKIQRSGKESLSDEENRFLKRVSDRYRNRQ